MSSKEDQQANVVGGLLAASITIYEVPFAVLEPIYQNNDVVDFKQIACNQAHRQLVETEVETQYTRISQALPHPLSEFWINLLKPVAAEGKTVDLPHYKGQYSFGQRVFDVLAFPIDDQKGKRNVALTVSLRAQYGKFICSGCPNNPLVPKKDIFIQTEEVPGVDGDSCEVCLSILTLQFGAATVRDQDALLQRLLPLMASGQNSPAT